MTFCGRRRESHEKRFKQVTLTEEKKVNAAHQELMTVTKKTQAAQIELDKVEAALQRARKSLVNAEGRTRDLLAREERIRQMDKAFSAMGVSAPERKARVLTEIDKLGGDPKKIHELVTKYNGVERAVMRVSFNLNHQRKQLRGVKTAFRQYERAR